MALKKATTTVSNEQTLTNADKDEIRQTLNLIQEAPIDGNSYVRKDAGWTITQETVIDTAFSDTSTNPVENRVLSELRHFTKVKTTNLTATEIKKLSYQKIICQAILTIDLDDTFDDTFNVIVQVDAGFTVTLNTTSPATVDNSTLTEGVYFLSKKNGTDEFVAKKQGSGSLIRKDEGNGEGYFLSGQNRANHGNIGFQAVDLSTQFTQSSTNGASGFNSLSAGYDTTASGDVSLSAGDGTTASGYASHAEGVNNYARAESEHSGGRFGTDYTPANDDTDRLLNYGNGTSTNRSDAFTVYKNGAIRIFREAIANITNTIKEGLLIFDSSNNNRPTIHNGTEWKGLAYFDEVGSGGEQNVQSDFSENDTNSDAYIIDKPDYRPFNKQLANVFSGLGGEYDDTGMTGVFDRSVTTDADLNGSVNVNVLAGSADLIGDVKELVNAENDFFELRNTTAGTEVEIFIDVGQNVDAYGNAKWMPFFQKRLRSNSSGRFRNIEVFVSDDNINWVTNSNWNITTYNDNGQEYFIQFANAKPNTPTTLTTWRYAKFVLKDFTLGSASAIEDRVYIRQLGIRHVSEVYAKQYAKRRELSVYENVQSDFAQSDDTQDNFIINRPIQAETNLALSGAVSIDITAKQSYIYNLTGNVDLTIDAINVRDLTSYVTELRVTSDTGTETLTLLNSTDTKDVYGTFDPTVVNKIVISATKDGSGNVYLSYFINQPN